MPLHAGHCRGRRAVFDSPSGNRRRAARSKRDDRSEALNDPDEDFPDGDAPGAPGIPPTWTSSSKDLVGTALGPARVWYTLGYGIVNEVYYPRVDLPQIRDLGFLVGDGRGFWVEVKRERNYSLTLAAPGVPAPTIVHTHPRYELTLRVAPDPERDVLLIEVELAGDETLSPYVLLAPHLGGSGHANVAAGAVHYQRRVLWAEQGPFGLALAAVDAKQREALGPTSAGYVGFSDGWQDFAKNGAMTWRHPRAGPGNVALLGKLERRCVLALGFGPSKGAAASLVGTALLAPFRQVWDDHVERWRRWHAACDARAVNCDLPVSLAAQYVTSRMVLRCHQDKVYPGAMVASLSVPWGNSRDERGGYHLVWPRDLVECAGALLGVGGQNEALDVLRYLMATQHADGHWNQNQWLGGTPFWTGVQLDETAFPVLLAALLEEQGALGGTRPQDMVRRALQFIVRTGPVSDQDRWEEDRGVNTFTLAVMIAALAAGAKFLDGADRDVALAIADDWNARIEAWTVCRHSSLTARFGLGGYYFRVAPAEALLNEEALYSSSPIKNRLPGAALPAGEQIATDFLQLVRYSLRRADDPIIRNTVVLADALLKVDTPAGPAWHRYRNDGYGEHEDGSPYDGTGVGRAWPLLTGERGHYELGAGRSPQPFLEAMAAMAGATGLLPEQVWDGAPIAALDLALGRPTGSAMPLAWAHAEFLKLALSARLGRVYDCPRAVRERYAHPGTLTQSVWSEHAPVRDFLAGTDLRVCLGAPGTVVWRAEPGAEWREIATAPGGLGLHTATLGTRGLDAAARVRLKIARGSAEAGEPPEFVLAPREAG
jgi:glucoamylase